MVVKNKLHPESFFCNNSLLSNKLDVSWCCFACVCVAGFPPSYLYSLQDPNPTRNVP